MRKVAILSVCALMLTGCGGTFQELKDAAAGIDSAAEEAASAISQDTHSVRAMTLTYDGQSVTVNDLFKKVLRDVQWRFDSDTATLEIKGTWLSSLFADAGLTEQAYENLAADGKVTVLLPVDERAVLTEQVKVSVHYHNNLIFEQAGQDLLGAFFVQYNKN